MMSDTNKILVTGGSGMVGKALQKIMPDAIYMSSSDCNLENYDDTLEYAMASPDGKWLGSGFNEIKESKLWWLGGVILSNQEPLTIEVSHAVRNNGEEKGVSKLKGIISLGISIEDE